MRVLYFDLYGPLAAFGSTAESEFRSADPRPTKSAIIGLLANILGYDREDRERIDALAGSVGLVSATVREDGDFGRRFGGESMFDYHTSQVAVASKGQEFRTRRQALAEGRREVVLSSREWLMDTFCVCGIWKTEESGPSLDQLSKGLGSPARVPYMGRKAGSLSLPMAPRIIEPENPVSPLQKDLASSPSLKMFDAILWKPMGKMRLDIGCDDGVGGIPIHARADIRRDLIAPRIQRGFHARVEKVFPGGVNG